jgi:hypothetical protein
MALISEALGERDEALKWLTKSYQVAQHTWCTPRRIHSSTVCVEILDSELIARMELKDEAAESFGALPCQFPLLERDCLSEESGNTQVRPQRAMMPNSIAE